MDIEKNKRKIILIIIVILIFIIILLASVIALSMNKEDTASEEKIDLSQQEDRIKEYLDGKMIPQGISSFEREYTGEIDRSIFYEQLYSISVYLPDLVADLKEITNIEDYYSENKDDIKKYIGIDNSIDFAEFVDYLNNYDISEDEINYCVYEKETIINYDEYSTFKMIFNYKNCGDIEFTVKLLNEDSEFFVLSSPLSVE